MVDFRKHPAVRAVRDEIDAHPAIAVLAAVALLSFWAWLVYSLIDHLLS